jgi:hypothetical protein
MKPITTLAACLLLGACAHTAADLRAGGPPDGSYALHGQVTDVAQCIIDHPTTDDVEPVVTGLGKRYTITKTMPGINPILLVTIDLNQVQPAKVDAKVWVSHPFGWVWKDEYLKTVARCSVKAAKTQQAGIASEAHLERS